MHDSGQQAHILNIDSKDRIGLPTQSHGFFQGTVHATYIRCGLLLHPEAKNGCGAIFKVDTNTNRITLGAGIYTVVGVTKTNPNSAIWIPYIETVRSEISFLLLLGEEGAERWNEIRARQDPVKIS